MTWVAERPERRRAPKATRIGEPVVAASAMPFRWRRRTYVAPATSALAVAVLAVGAMSGCGSTAYPVSRQFELKRRLTHALIGEAGRGNYILRDYSSSKPTVWTSVTDQGTPVGEFVNRALGPSDRYLANPAYVGVDIRSLPGDAVLFIASFDDGPMVPVLKASDVSFLFVTPPR